MALIAIVLVKHQWFLHILFLSNLIAQSLLQILVDAKKWIPSRILLLNFRDFPEMDDGKGDI